jgi:hypothetical protein
VSDGRPFFNSYRTPVNRHLQNLSCRDGPSESERDEDDGLRKISGFRQQTTQTSVEITAPFWRDV